jgi:hypothetical protein
MNSRLFYQISVCLAMVFIGLFTVTTQGFGGTEALIGTWGYTVLGHATPDTNGFFTWKTEAGTIVIRGNGTLTVSYGEGADICPTLDYCKAVETATVPYTATANADGSITLIRNPGADQDVMRFVVSDDGSMAFGDGTATGPYEQMFIIAVRLDTVHTYGASDVSGNYYSAGYEHDALGGQKGYYRLQSYLSAMNGLGSFIQTGKLNGDGALMDIGSVSGTYTVDASGKILMNGRITGYAGNGKVAIFSNPGLAGGVTDDWASYIALKKADKTYSTSDIAGRWALVSFEDNTGTLFYSKIGTANCNTSGNCTIAQKLKSSDGSITYDDVSANITLASDGSFNEFYLTNADPHLSGAIGNNGNTMMVLNTNGNQRNLTMLIKCASCSNLEGRIYNTLTVSKSGNGSGTVTSSLSGINCGSSCSTGFGSDTTVVLTASATVGSTFTGWNNCPSADGATCTVPMSTSRTVTATFTGTTPASSLALLAGWNLVSLPLQPANTAIASVLSDVSGFYSILWAYPSQSWKFYDPNDIEGSTLKTMEAGKAYWVKMTEGKILATSGAAPSASLSLATGWNLVGYNGSTCSAAGTALSSLGNTVQIVWAYLSQSWKFYDPNDTEGSTLTQICPKYGYWIKVNQPGTWSGW